MFATGLTVHAQCAFMCYFDDVTATTNGTSIGTTGVSVNICGKKPLQIHFVSV